MERFTITKERLEREKQSQAERKYSKSNDSSIVDGEGSRSMENDAMLAAKLQAELNGRFLRDSKKKRRKAQTGSVQKKTRKVTEGIRKNPFHAELQLSPVLADILGHRQLSRPQVVREIWAYIRKYDLQNPENKKEIICDDKFRKIFGEKTDIFSMNRLLKPHLFKADEVVSNSQVYDKRDVVEHSVKGEEIGNENDAINGEESEISQTEVLSQPGMTESDLEAQALEAAIGGGTDDEL